ncbi:MAG: hypothetical protein ABIH20_03880 [Candidatus Diapherotrites archaeon]
MGKTINRIKKSASAFKKAINKKTVAIGGAVGLSLIGAIESPRWQRVLVNDSVGRAGKIILTSQRMEGLSPKQLELQKQLRGYLGARSLGKLKEVRAETLSFIKTASKRKLENFIVEKNLEIKEVQRMIEYSETISFWGKNRGVKELENLVEFFDFVIKEAEKEINIRFPSKPLRPEKIVLTKRSGKLPMTRAEKGSLPRR